MPGPVCAPCGLEMRAHHNGVMTLQNDKEGRPYRVWMADEYVCAECGCRILTGWGMHPVATRHEERFESFRAMTEQDFVT